MRGAARTTRGGLRDVTNQEGFLSAHEPAKATRQAGGAVGRALPQAPSKPSEAPARPSRACSHPPRPPQRAPRLGGQASAPRLPAPGIPAQVSNRARTRKDAPGQEPDDFRVCTSSAVVVTRSPPDFRSWCDPENLQHVAEYAPEIFQLLLKEETKYLPPHDYMNFQKDINAKMRAILMDWIVEVHMKYKLRDETLHLTCMLIDRYLAARPVVRKRLQLVGVVAMFIAAKFEEINPPGVDDYEYITDNAYTKDDILVMECQMLTTLNFQIVIPTVAHFMDPLQRMNICDDAHKQFVSYLCELALLEMRMFKYTPSHLVSAALLLSNELTRRTISWPLLLQESTQHTEEDLRPCVQELQDLLDQAPAHWLQAVRKKYLSPQHHSVARRWP